MKIIKNPELKGILALIGIAIVLAFIFFAFTGKLTEWFGIRFTLKEPLTDSIVFVSDRNGSPDIWAMDSDGANQRALTSDGYADSDPTVSPDGYTILYVSKHDHAYSQIYAIDVDGTHPRRLTDMTGAKSSPRFSADGKSIIFICAGDVWRIGMLGDRPRRTMPTDAELATSRMSGDEQTPYIWAEPAKTGDAIAAIKSTANGEIITWIRPGDFESHTVSTKSGDQTVPLGGEKVGASWSAAENELAVTMTDRNGRAILATADLDRENAALVLAMDAIGNPDWSPDGYKIAAELLRRTGLSEYEARGIVLLSVYGGEPEVIVEGDARMPKWSPDGTKIIFVKDHDIWSIDSESGETANLTKGEGSNYSASWAPKVKK